MVATTTPTSEERPRLIDTSQHVTFSTCMAVDVERNVVWDVNGYYAAFGVPTDATRRALLRAYQALDGQNDVWLTMALRVLVDSTSRAQYDAMPFGSLYIDDHLREAAHRREVEEIGEYMRGGIEEDLAKKIVSAIYEHTEDDQIHQVLGAREIEQGYVPPLDMDAIEGETTWPWAYYVWGLERGDTDLLARWQAALVSALWTDRSISTQLAIGLHDVDRAAWKIVQVGYRTVVFLHHLASPEDHANEAATHLTNRLTGATE